MTDPTRSEFQAGDAELDREQLARERQELLADMAERQRKAEAARVLAEARERNATAPVTKSYSSNRRSAPAPAPASLTRNWQDYIRRELDRRDRVAQHGIAIVLVELERARQAEVAELRDQVVALQSEVAELKNRDLDRRLRSVPTIPSALIA